MHLQHGQDCPQQVIWPSHPTQAPLSNFFPLAIKQSLTKYRHLGLSDPSITRSYQSKFETVYFVMNGCQFILIFGLSSSKVDLREVVFEMLRVLVLCPICRCKLVISTTSESNSPIVPTPAPARYNAKGHPIPPAPTNPTFAQTIFTCPVYPIYFSNICLEYLANKSPNRTGFKLVCNGPQIKSLCSVCCAQQNSGYFKYVILF